MINLNDWQPRLSRRLRDNKGKDLGEVVTSWEYMLDDITITLAQSDYGYDDGVSDDCWELSMNTDEADIDLYTTRIKFSPTSHIEAKREAVKLITNLTNKMMKLI